MTILEKKLDALMRYASADNDFEKDKLRKEIRQLLCESDPTIIYSEKERDIRNVLLDLNAPEHMVGYLFTVDAIMLAIQNEFYIHNMKWGIYEPIAQKHNTSITSVDRGISNIIDAIWYRTQHEKLYGYFKGIISEGRDKPTNSQFISRLANLVKYELHKDGVRKCF